MSSNSRTVGGRGWSVLAKPRFSYRNVKRHRGFPAVQPRPPQLEDTLFSIALHPKSHRSVSRMHACCRHASGQAMLVVWLRLALTTVGNSATEVRYCIIDRGLAHCIIGNATRYCSQGRVVTVLGLTSGSTRRVRRPGLVCNARNSRRTTRVNLGVRQNGSLHMKTTALLLMMLVPAVVSAQEKPTTGYAPVNGLKMYYEVHGSGDPVVLLHGAFMTITNNWTGWIAELSKTRKVIAIEMQGHGRTADINRDFTYENLADDVAGLLDYLKIPSADIIGYSLGGGVAIQCAIRHPEKVRKVVSISAPIRRDGWVKEANDFWPAFIWELFKGTPMEADYKRLSPTPEKFPDFVNHIKAQLLRPYDFGADKLKATKAPMFFIFGDADGVRFDHIAEMYRLKGGGEIHGDMQPRPASRLAILPDTTHVTLMNRTSIIIPMINDFLNAKPQK